MIDSHCHLGIDDFKKDVSDYLKRAKEKGVTHILTVACDYDHISDLLEMSLYENVYTAIGIHPENAEKFDYDQLKEIFLTNQNINALGEIGLDFFYNPETKNKQINVFESQIELASTLKKPIIVHTRNADNETIDILKSTFKNNLLNNKGVMHCFCGSYDLAKVALDVGLYISFSGIITFKNANELREVASKIPLDRLLIETDAPYLAPVPHRGKENEPSYLPYTLNCLANLKNVTSAEMEEITTQNFLNLFKGE